MIKTMLESLTALALAFALHLPLAVQAAEIHVKPATELSGSAVTPDGKGLLIAEDERIGAVFLIPEQPATTDAIHGAVPVKFERKREKIDPEKGRHKVMPVQDFEGIASDGKKDVFFVGSHHPKCKCYMDDCESVDCGENGECAKGEKRKNRRFDREFLIRAKLKKDNGDWELKLKKRGEYYGLLAVLEAPFKKEFDIELFPDDASGSCSGNKKGKILHPDSDLNIEGLAYHDEKLYIGFRAPLTDDKHAIIAVIDAKKPFKKARGSCRENPKVKAKLIEVNLGGAGIRSLDWDPGKGEGKKGKLLILSGVSDSSDKAGDATDELEPPKLWKYEPGNGEPEEGCYFEKKPKPAPEGVSRWGDRITVVFDDEGEEASARIAYLSNPMEKGKECRFEP